MRLIAEVPPSRDRERRYILDVLLGEFLGIEFEMVVADRSDVRLTVAARAGTRDILVDDSFFSGVERSWLLPESLPRRPVRVWRAPADDLPVSAAVERDLPVVFGRDPREGGFLTVSAARAELRLDLFGSSFFCLTRYEEAVSSARDVHDRFPAAASLALQEGFLDRPIVNEYVEVLWSLIRWLEPGAVRRARGFSVALTHDVDRPLYAPAKGWRALTAACASDVGSGDVDLAAKKIAAKAAGGFGNHAMDPCNTFGWIMDLSERFGYRSAFYFITGPSPERPGGRYSMDDPWIRRLLGRIHARGHEIGLHPSYETYLDPHQTRWEFDRLVEIAEEEGITQTGWGGRQHYLRWANPDTWRILDEVGLCYDATLGFADHVGFRCGVCYEFPVYDLERREPLRLRERPLTVMDGSLLLYMGLDDAEAFNAATKLADACRRHGGEFSLLWHNSSLMRRRDRRLYRNIVEEISR